MAPLPQFGSAIADALQKWGWVVEYDRNDVVKGHRTPERHSEELVAVWILDDVGSFEEPTELSIQARASVRVVDLEGWLRSAKLANSDTLGLDTAAVFLTQTPEQPALPNGWVIDTASDWSTEVNVFVANLEARFGNFFGTFRRADWFECAESWIVESQPPVEWEFRRAAYQKLFHDSTRNPECCLAVIADARKRVETALARSDRARAGLPGIVGVSEARTKSALGRFDDLIKALCTKVERRSERQ